MTTTLAAALPIAVPHELAVLPQWVAWRWETRDGKPTKPPVSPGTGSRASTTDRSTWARHAEALTFAEENQADGIGFIFTADDPYAGIDLDKCRDAGSGSIAPWARAIIDYLHSYTEVSPSGTGVKIFVVGDVPSGLKRGSTEMYGQGRYFTVTGDHVDDTPRSLERRDIEVGALYRWLNTHPAPARAAPSTAVSTLCDKDVLRRALAATNGAAFQRLWAGDWEGYASQSEADLALCAHLAFWTADPGAVDRLFRQSGLYRAKWDEPHYGNGRTYGDATIGKALASASKPHSNGHPASASAVAAPPDVAPVPFVAKTVDEWLGEAEEPLEVVISDGGEGAVLPNDGKGFIAGPTGVGKTNLLLRLGRCLAEGTPFLGLLIPKPRRVLHLALEGSRRGLRRRLAKVWSGADPEARSRFYLAQVQLNVGDEEGLRTLDSLLNQAAPEVLIVDPLRNAHPWDENSSQDMARLTATLDSIIWRRGCAIIAAHHDRKRPPLMRKDIGTDRVRGSTALAGWLSFCLSVEAEPAHKDRLTAEWTKLRDAEESLPTLSLDFDREAINYTAREAAPGKIADDDILTPVFHAGREGVRGKELIAHLRESTGGGERTIRDAIRALVDEGRIEEFVALEDRRSKAKSYRLREPLEDE